LALTPVLAFAGETVEFVWRGKGADVPGCISKTVRYGVPQGRGRVLIAERGAKHPPCRIVLAANPTRSAQLAAAEFKRHVEVMTGELLDVVTDDSRPFEGNKVLIGESRLTRALGLRRQDFEPQEHLIRTCGNILVLMGRDEPEYGVIHYDRHDFWGGFGASCDWGPAPEWSKLLGSVYAVHAFLQEFCGVRWYLPGELGEVCPRRDVLEARDIDRRRRPWTAYRAIGMHWWRDDYLAQGGWTIRDVFLWKLRMKLFGVEAYACNHSLVPQWFEKRFPDAPEILAQGYERPSQLCLSSERLLGIVCRDADDYFAGRTNHARASGDYFPVMPHDNQHYCKCGACQARIKPGDGVGRGFWSDRTSNCVWRLVNRVAKHVKREHPGKWVGCCSYARYAFYPDAPALSKLEDNVFAMVCRPLPGAVRDPEYGALANGVIEDWAGRVRRWYVWEYFSHIQSQSPAARFPLIFIHAIRRDLRRLHELGCRGVFNEYESYLRDCALGHLNVYVHLQLLNDVEYDVDRALNEYCKLFYGPASEPMQRFFALMIERGGDSANYAPVRDGAPKPSQQVSSWERICPPSVLDRLGAMLEEARRATHGAGVYERRVAWVREHGFADMVKNCHRHNYGCVRRSGALAPDERAAGAAFVIFDDNPGRVLSPAAIHVDRDDNIFVGEYGASEVLKLDQSGRVLLRIPFECNSISGVATDRHGRIYVIGSNGILYKLHPDGAACSDFVDPITGLATHQVRGFHRAGGLWLADDGKILVAFEKERRVRRCHADATPDRSFASEGSAQLDCAPSAFVGAAGRLYALDHRSGCLQALAAKDGSVLARFEPDEGVSLARSLYAVRDRVYVGLMAPRGVLVLDPDLKSVVRLAIPGSYPMVVAADSRGRLLIGTDKGGLLVYDADGKPAALAGGSNWLAHGGLVDGQFALPSALALDGRGDLLVCESRTKRIQAIDPDTGRFLAKFHTRAAHNSAIAVDAAGAVYVGSLAYSRVAKFGPDGKPLWQKGAPGKEVGRFGQVSALLVAPDGTLLVGEGGGARVQAFNQELEPVPRFGGASTLPCTRTQGGGAPVPSPCAGLAIDAEGRLYVSQGRGPGVVKLTPDGVPIPEFGHPKRAYIGERTFDLNPAPRAFHWPGSVAVDAASGDVYVADTRLHCIKRFDKRGRFRGSFGSPGYGPGQFRCPRGLLLDGKGHLYLCDQRNSRIYRLNLADAFPGERDTAP